MPTIQLSRARLLLALAGCGDGADGGVEGPALDLPPVIAIPYVVAGEGEATAQVAVPNVGSEAAAGLRWSLDGDPSIAVASAPETIEAGAAGLLDLRFAGAEVETIAGAVLTVELDGAPARTAEVWAVAGDPGLGDAGFAPVPGAGGVTIGASTVVSMPTAPFPHEGAPWTDDRVHLFVPEGYREAGDGQDVVLHFHGHNTTIDDTVPGHRYREQVYASGANVILAVPQGPVEAASGEFGKLDTPAGTAAFLAQVLVVLYRADLIERPVLGQTILTSHSGGYAAVAGNLGGDPPLPVAQVSLFDSLYGFVATYQDYALGGGRLRSSHTATGGTRDNNLALVADLEAAGLDVITAPTAGALRDAGAVIFATAASHGGCTRDDAAYAEQLRWGARRGGRGPRVELRSAVGGAGGATLTWLAPPDADLAGWRVETSDDGASWALAAEVAADAGTATIGLDGAARVRLVPVVDGVALDDAQPSDVYRVAPGGAEVLIVDGFDRVIDGSFGERAHDAAARVGEAAGLVDTVASEAITEDGFDLSGYRTVIWLVGDESTEDHTFTAAERDAIDAYLDGGGRVILSGSEIGYELGASAAAWLAVVAGASYAGDDAGSVIARGAGPLAAIAPFGFGGAAALYREEYPDVLAATGDGEVVLAYDTGAAAAVGIAGRGAWVGFPLEVIEDPADRAAVVAALLELVGSSPG